MSVEAIYLALVRVEFSDDDLDRLEADESAPSRFSADIVRAYRKRMQFIRGALDERDFRSMKSLHFERLKGSRRNQHSLRLNDQFRLIIELVGSGRDKRVRIVSIEDYH